MIHNIAQLSCVLAAFRIAACLQLSAEAQAPNDWRDLNNANGSWHNGEYGKVVRHCDRLIQRRQFLYESHILRGRAQLKLGDLKKAQGDFQLAEPLAPRGKCQVMFCHGLASFRLKQYPEAVAYFTTVQAFGADTVYGKAYLDYSYEYEARSFLAMKEYEQADACFTRMLKRNPNEPLALSLRSRMRLQLGDSEGALKDLTRLLRVFPDYSSGYKHSGEITEKQKDRAAAIVDRIVADRPAIGIHLDGDDPLLSELVVRIAGGARRPELQWKAHAEKRQFTASFSSESKCAVIEFEEVQIRDEPLESLRFQKSWRNLIRATEEAWVSAERSALEMEVKSGRLTGRSGRIKFVETCRKLRYQSDLRIQAYVVLVFAPAMKSRKIEFDPAVWKLGIDWRIGDWSDAHGKETNNAEFERDFDFDRLTIGKK